MEFCLHGGIGCMIKHKLYNFELIVFSCTNEGGSRSNVVVLMVPNRASGAVSVCGNTTSPLTANDSWTFWTPLRPTVAPDRRSTSSLNWPEEPVGGEFPVRTISARFLQIRFSRYKNMNENSCVADEVTI